MEPKKVSDYSPRNQLLILSVNPDATELAGYKQWRAMGRQVRKGERAIPIAAPVTRKQDDGTSRMVNVRGARVFDVSQTDPRTAETDEAREGWRKATDNFREAGEKLRADSEYRKRAGLDAATVQQLAAETGTIRDPGEDMADRWAETH